MTPDAAGLRTAAAAGLLVPAARSQSVLQPRGDGPVAANLRRVQIDGLRAIAMIGVLYVHFWHRDAMTENVRVSLFFVVSGFIITHILSVAKAHGGRIHVLNFYLRRMLRLFPSLAMMVAVAFAFDMDGFRQSALWHILQLTNVHYALTSEIKPWVVGQLWSLNVLEQFYLVWPLVVLLLPHRQVYGAALLLAGMMVLLRNHGTLLGIEGWWRYMVFATDPVAIGSLFYLLQAEPEIATFIRSWTALGASLLVLVSPYLLTHDFGATETYRLMIQPALAVIVVGAFHGFRGPVGWLLGSAVTQFLSKISYSVFVYHLTIWWLVMQISPTLTEQGPLTFVVMSGLTAGVAALSWYAMEAPLARLKRHFPTATHSDETRRAP